VYAILLGWPGAGQEIMLNAFAEAALPDPVKIASVTLLGSDDPIEWELREQGLALQSPEAAPDEMAVVFKIKTR
jgi:hypothetical protein